MFMSFSLYSYAFQDAAKYRDELMILAPHSLLKCSSDATTLVFSLVKYSTDATTLLSFSKKNSDISLPICEVLGFLDNHLTV